jgi:hypothetical protein
MINGSSDLPWLCTPSVRAFLAKVLGTSQKRNPVSVTLAPYREAIIDMISCLEHLHEFAPYVFAAPGAHECSCIANEDKGIPGSGEKDI